MPSRDTFEALKQAAVILLDCLSKDSAQPQRKDDWLRVAAIEDLPLQDTATRQTATQQLESAARENYLC
jgi:ATP-dependent Lon protease